MRNWRICTWLTRTLNREGLLFYVSTLCQRHDTSVRQEQSQERHGFRLGITKTVFWHQVYTPGHSRRNDKLWKRTLHRSPYDNIGNGALADWGEWGLLPSKYLGFILFTFRVNCFRHLFRVCSVDNSSGSSSNSGTLVTSFTTKSLLPLAGSLLLWVWIAISPTVSETVLLKIAFITPVLDQLYPSSLLSSSLRVLGFDRESFT